MGLGKFLKKVIRVAAPVAAIALPGVGGAVAKVASVVGKASKVANAVDAVRILKGKQPKYSIYTDAAQSVLSGNLGESAAIGSGTPAMQQQVVNAMQAGQSMRSATKRRRRKSTKRKSTKRRKSTRGKRRTVGRRPRRKQAQQVEGMGPDEAPKPRKKRKYTGPPYGPGHPLWESNQRRKRGG